MFNELLISVFTEMENRASRPSSHLWKAYFDRMSNDTTRLQSAGLFFTCEVTLVSVVNSPTVLSGCCPLLKDHRKPQSSADHRTSLTPSSGTSHLRLVSHYPWPPPRRITTASSASRLRVSEASRNLFPHQTTTLFSTPLELSVANSSAWGHDSVPHGEEL